MIIQSIIPTKSRFPLAAAAMAPPDGSATVAVQGVGLIIEIGDMEVTIIEENVLIAESFNSPHTLALAYLFRDYANRPVLSMTVINQKMKGFPAPCLNQRGEDRNPEDSVNPPQCKHGCKYWPGFSANHDDKEVRSVISHVREVCRIKRIPHYVGRIPAE